MPPCAMQVIGVGGWRGRQDREKWLGGQKAGEESGGPGRESNKKVGKKPWKIENKFGSRSRKGYIEASG